MDVPVEDVVLVVVQMLKLVRAQMLEVEDMEVTEVLAVME